MKPRLYLFYPDRLKNIFQVLILKYDGRGKGGWGEVRMATFCQSLEVSVENSPAFLSQKLICKSQEDESV